MILLTENLRAQNVGRELVFSADLCYNGTNEKPLPWGEVAAKPTESYVDAINGYIKCEDANEFLTYDEVKELFTHCIPGYESSLMQAAENFHESQYLNNSLHVTWDVDSAFVSSAAVNTIDNIALEKKLFVNHPYSLLYE